MPKRVLPLLTFSLIALSLLFAPVSQVRADGGHAGLHTTVDGYTVELIFPDGQPKAGPNAALVRILDADGRPVSSAAVQVAPAAVQIIGGEQHGHGDSGHAESSASGHASATADGHSDANASGHSDAAATGHADTAGGHTHPAGEQHADTIMTQMEAGAEAGSYSSVIHFDSAGAWEIRLQFADAGIDHAAHFAVTVAEPARDWRILGAFGGANLLIIAAAAIMRRRYPVIGKGSRQASATIAES